MIYNLNHTTTYEYNNPVSLSHHTLRLLPRELQRQVTHRTELIINPEPSTVTSHIDYFGNATTFVTVEGAHRKLVVTAKSRVEVFSNSLPNPEDTPAWEDVPTLCEEASVSSAEYLRALEFTYPTNQIKNLPEFAEYARPSFTPRRPLLDAVIDLTSRIYKDFKFDSKATTVATPLEQVYKTRRGVCQDFAQFQIACLRAMKIPARYVSGYLETDPPPGKPRLVGADASHAWVAFFSPGHGWIDVDPTNNILPSHRHVTIAWGRDFHDVSPIRGVILGSGDHSLKVSVDVAPETGDAQKTKEPL